MTDLTNEQLLEIGKRIYAVFDYLYMITKKPGQEKPENPDSRAVSQHGNPAVPAGSGVASGPETPVSSPCPFCGTPTPNGAQCSHCGRTFKDGLQQPPKEKKGALGDNKDYNPSITTQRGTTGKASPTPSSVPASPIEIRGKAGDSPPGGLAPQQSSPMSPTEIERAGTWEDVDTPKGKRYRWVFNEKRCSQRCPKAQNCKNYEDGQTCIGNLSKNWKPKKKREA